MNTDKLMPQHDLDERNSLGRATPAEWSTFASGRASITEAGREALRPALTYEQGWKAAMTTVRPYLDNLFATAYRIEAILGGPSDGEYFGRP